MNLPDKQRSREDRLRRVVADYREALRQQNAPSIDEVVAKNSDLGEELRHKLSTIEAEALGQTDNSATGAPEHDVTVEWSPTEATEPPEPVETTRSATQLMPGSVVGEYRLLRELGRGGMGVVYETEHAESGRRLALKLLSPNLPRTQQTVQRFLNEASLAAGLSHPRTTFVYEAGERDGQFFISMELMPGRTLKDVIQSEGALPVNRAVDYILDVLEGLEAAHKTGVIHRDVKPSNCFLDDQGRVKVGDFGLSKSLVAARDLTQTGTFLGTPQFAAPEQFGRGHVDHRTDVYAAAATLFFLLTGSPPFQGDAAAVIAQIAADDPPLLTHLNSGVPKSLSRIVAKALSKDPSRRYQNSAELRNALIPYSTDGTSVADVGRRVAAFLVDTFLISIVISVVTTVVTIVHYGIQASANEAFSDYLWISSLIWLPYFAVSEGVFSRSLGKTWLRLRVVDVYGEPPGIGRAALRSIVVPGLSWMLIDILHWQHAFQWSQDLRETGQSSVLWHSIVIPQALTLARGLLLLLVCGSMRRSNGFRGLHEFASGTRVIRYRLQEESEELSTVPYYASVTGEDIPQSIGPFAVRGLLSVRGTMQILAARDEQLDRPVWVYVDGAEVPLSDERRRVARVTRQRWLSEGTVANGKWHALEAIPGAPLPEVTRHVTIPWGTARQIWFQAAEELKTAEADGTLPDHLSIDQIWLDRRGRLKLSDFPLRSAAEINTCSSGAGDVEKRSDMQTSGSAGQCILRLLRQIGELCTVDDETPADALDLLDDLRKCSNSDFSSKLMWERMQAFVSRPYQLRWDDRLGIVAASVGIETILFCSPALFVSSLLASFGLSVPLTVTLAGAMGLSVSAVVGYLMRGGPAFWLTKTEVRNRDGRRVSGRRCVWRNVIAWFPMVMLNAAAGPWWIAVTRQTTPAFGMEFAVLGMYQVVLGIALLFGVLYSIAQPRRGLQDWLAGTRLVRRAA